MLKHGQKNLYAPIDPVSVGLAIGATFLARSFSGDKEQLVPILKAAAMHRGFALVDVLSPCVTFNDHEGSTKSYRYMRQHEVQVTESDFIPQRSAVVASIPPDGVQSVAMHDGSVLHFRSVPPDYDPIDRVSVMRYLQERHDAGEVATGILYVDEEAPNLHELSNTSETPLVRVPYEKLCPGAKALKELQRQWQ